jgi:hypothetical protein
MLLSRKEKIAAKHVCGRAAQKSAVLVWRYPNREDLNRYFDREIRRLMPA